MNSNETHRYIGRVGFAHRHVVSTHSACSVCCNLYPRLDKASPGGAPSD